MPPGIIPADQVIDEVDNGWRVANASLGYERSGVGARAVELYAQLDDLVELARLAVEGDGRACADGWWQDAFLYGRAYTIAGGANEVLKTVVAERALGLPRDKR
jgi:alkylation response protein AidB-like acyl-CoA dehydrogenase